MSKIKRPLSAVTSAGPLVREQKPAAKMRKLSDFGFVKVAQEEELEQALSVYSRAPLSSALSFGDRRTVHASASDAKGGSDDVMGLRSTPDQHNSSSLSAASDAGLAKKKNKPLVITDLEKEDAECGLLWTEADMAPPFPTCMLTVMRRSSWMV